jgi:CubicO group peptidase (beta-lactamase class C family)
VSTPTAVPADTPTAVPSPTAAPTTAPRLDADADISGVEPFLDKLGKVGLFAGVALIARDGKIIFGKAWGDGGSRREYPEHAIDN